MPRLEYICVARTKIHLRAIIHNDLHVTRNYIPCMAHLAALGLGEGLYVLRPLPSWLKNSSGDFKVADGGGLQLALFEVSGLIRIVEALLLASLGCHRHLLLSPASP